MNELVMDVGEARELMPKITSKLSDKEVEQMIINMEVLAEVIVKAVQFDEEFRVNIAYNRGG